KFVEIARVLYEISGLSRRQEIHIAGAPEVKVRSFFAHIGTIHNHVPRQLVLHAETPGLFIWPRVAVANGPGDAEADIGQETVSRASGWSGTAREWIAQEAPGR